MVLATTSALNLRPNALSALSTQHINNNPDLRLGTLAPNAPRALALGLGAGAAGSWELEGSRQPAVARQSAVGFWLFSAIYWRAATAQGEQPPGDRIKKPIKHWGRHPTGGYGPNGEMAVSHGSGTEDIKIDRTTEGKIDRTTERTQGITHHGGERTQTARKRPRKATWGGRPWTKPQANERGGI
jgi:hypothetical protein